MPNEGAEFLGTTIRGNVFVLLLLSCLGKGSICMCAQDAAGQRLLCHAICASFDDSGKEVTNQETQRQQKVPPFMSLSSQ